MGLERLAASVAALFVSLAWAGCTNTPSAPSATEPTASLPLPSTPPFPTDLPPVNTSVPFYTYSNCTEILMPFEAAQATVTSVVPAAFKPWGDTSATANLLIVAKECDRSLDNRTVFGPVSEYWAIAFVRLANQSWGEDAYYDYYVLDYYTSSQNLSTSLAQLGINVGVGAFSISKTALPEGTQLWTWTLESSGMEARFNHRMKSEHPQPGDFKVHFWMGNGPYRRVDAIVHYTVDTLLNEGTLLLQGDTRFDRSYGSKIGAHYGTSHINVSWSYELDTELFDG